MGTKADTEKILELYKLNTSVTRTARELGISRKTAAWHLHTSGIITGRPGPKSRIEEQKVATLYNQGKPARMIAVMLGIGKTRITYIIKKLGLSRSKSEALNLAFASGRKSHVREHHPNWKGGTRRDKAGYVFLYMPEHPRAKLASPYVQEHIVVWEKAHNQPLPEGHVVHHLNGIKDDNRPENLMALGKGQHHSKLLDLALKQRIRELEIQLKVKG